METDSVFIPTTEVKPKQPIINCHAHIFTGDHVPPYLAKSIIVAPFYKLFNFQWIFFWFRKYYKKKDTKRFDGSQNLEARTKFQNEKKYKKKYVHHFFNFIISTYLTVWAIDILLHWLFTIPTWPPWLAKFLQNSDDVLHKIYLPLNNIWLQVVLILFVFLFFKTGRKLIKALLKAGIYIFRNVPSKQIKELYDRYITIGRFAFHNFQSKTLEDLEEQYPEGTGFVILPMDMMFMNAGFPKKSYIDQMQELAQIKARRDNIYPFVFVDPRRIKEDKTYFDYKVENGKVVLKDCFIKDYIEGHNVKNEDGEDIGIVKFSGFKIYPALGYYPFDPLLLPVWKYAAQQGLPILTHCVRGPMYYRGKKKGEWDYHPIFQELIKPVPKGTKVTEEHFTNILLPQTKNDEFASNFTHPMNFLCLLKKEFLIKAVEIAMEEADAGTKQNLKDMFGYNGAVPANDKVPAIAANITTGLDDLKLCFGHYGGNDEWINYFEKDRFNHSAQVASYPETGIDFIFKVGKGPKVRSLGKPEQLWKYTDWYSIISSIMLQHKNVYADISYILHADANILPLLKQTLQNKGLRGKILYGTDFFVVRNHKSDKNMLADMMGGLDEKDFDVIARENPRKFLNLP